MSKGNPFLALRLAPETMERLRETSVRQGRGVSDLAREALARGLQSDPATAGVGAFITQDNSRVAQRHSGSSRRRSRVQRLSMAIEELRSLLAEYEGWQSNLPDFADSSATAEKLEAAVEALATAADTLEELDLPLGYGRD